MLLKSPFLASFVVCLVLMVAFVAVPLPQTLSKIFVCVCVFFFVFFFVVVVTFYFPYFWCLDAHEVVETVVVDNGLHLLPRGLWLLAVKMSLC